MVEFNMSSSALVPYETRLNRDRLWALREGSMHFEKESAVFRTLRKITSKLDELGIPYAIADGMALFLHGYRRFTEDVDLLVTPEGLQAIHEKLDGLGYLPVFRNSKQLRDAETGVRIEFLVTGQYPGDGKPKAVAFPDPASVATEQIGMRVVTLPKLIELKLASGLSAVHRARDLVDVQELIGRLGLSYELVEQLAPLVQDKYLELWKVAQATPPDER
jgi:hypothetical protein